MNSTVDSFQKIVVHRYKNLVYRVDRKSSLDTNSPFVEMQGFNRLCGDRITVFGRFAENSTRLNYEAASCAICQVSADIMCECLSYLPVETAHKIANQFVKDITGSLDGNLGLKSEAMNPPYPSLVNDLMMIRSLPSRVRCVTLPWETFSSLCKEKVCHSEL